MMEEAATVTMLSMQEEIVNTSHPRVSIGLPVYNGENYLAETLDSLLAQTFTDFELIISDNASTDRTQEICEAYAARDPRIRYVRNETNVGATRNFNSVFEHARGEYFKWAAHDDLCAPEFLEACVAVLDHNPEVVLCIPRALAIDKDGNVVKDSYNVPPQFSSPKPWVRFHACVNMIKPQISVFGVIRSSILRKTPLIGNYPASDRVILGELTLHGPMYEVPKYLFYYRNHPQQSWRAHRSGYARWAWFDPKLKKKRFSLPHWRLFLEHVFSIHRASHDWGERVRCYVYMLPWVRKNWRYMVKNLLFMPTPI